MLLAEALIGVEGEHGADAGQVRADIGVAGGAVDHRELTERHPRAERGQSLLLTVGDIVVARRAGWLQAVLRIVLRTTTIAAVAYLAFLLTWGFNYRRIRLEDKLQFDSSRISADAAATLGALLHGVK